MTLLRCTSRSMMPDWFFDNQMYAVMQPSAAALKGDQEIALQTWNDDRFARRCPAAASSNILLPANEEACAAPFPRLRMSSSRDRSHIGVLVSCLQNTTNHRPRHVCVGRGR